MEGMGQINEYVARGQYGVARRSFFTINLATGVTPFMASFADAQGNWWSATSTAYRLTVGVVTVTHGWYRPGQHEFDRLPASGQRHVLTGGLLLAPLAEAGVLNTLRTAALDIAPDISYSSWRDVCETLYGTRPPEAPTDGTAVADRREAEGTHLQLLRCLVCGTTDRQCPVCRDGEVLAKVGGGHRQG
jgi:hypothetical protein